MDALPVATDLPRRVGLEAYEICREAVRRRVLEHPTALAAYVAGEVRYPGHSDLDVFVVLPDDAPIAPVVGPADLPEPGPYLANHSFPHYPRSIFREIHYLFPLFGPLEPLVEKEPIEIAPPPDDPMLAAFYAVDYLFKKVFRLLETEAADRLPVRTTLCHLHTVRYTLALVERATGEPLGADYASAIDRLRGGWFDLDPVRGLEAIRDLIVRAIRLGFEAAQRLDAVLGPAPEARLVNRECALLFRPGGFDPEPAHALARANRLDWKIPGTRRRIRVQPIAVPSGLATVLSTYAAGDGPWSAWIARGLSPGPGALPTHASEAVRRRRRALDAVARLSLAQPIKNSYPYGFPPAGREGTGRRLAARLVERHFRRFAARAARTIA